MTPPFSSDQTALVRRNPWVVGLAASPLGLALVDLLVAAATGHWQGLVVLPHLLVLGVVLPLLAWRRNPKPRDVPARIEVNEQGIVRDGALLVARAEMRDAFVMPRRDGALIVRVRRKGLRLPVDLRVSSRDEGRALLRALGFDASQAAATFRVPSRTFAERKWRLAIPAVLTSIAVASTVLSGGHRTPHSGAVLFAMLIVAVVSAMLALIVPSRLRVGADGIFYTWLWWKRFFPYGEVARVLPYAEGGIRKNRMLGIEITLQSGEIVRIPVQQRQGGSRDEMAIVEERIAEAMETWRRGEGSADAARVGRSGRDTAVWLRALKGIGAGAHADARTAPIVPEKLWRIVEDPAAPQDARAGAAVALGAAIDGEGRARLRAAAEATAAPKLRIVMEAAAKETSDEELAAALAEVESAPERRRDRVAGSS